MTRFVPEVVVWPAEVAAALDAIIALQEDEMAANKALAPVLARNGWTPRMVILGTILADAAARIVPLPAPASPTEGDER